MPGQPVAGLGIKSKLPGKLGVFPYSLQCVQDCVCVCRSGELSWDGKKYSKGRACIYFFCWAGLSSGQ